MLSRSSTLPSSPLTFLIGIINFSVPSSFQPVMGIQSDSYLYWGGLAQWAWSSLGIIDLIRIRGAGEKGREYSWTEEGLLRPWLAGLPDHHWEREEWQMNSSLVASFWLWVYFTDWPLLVNPTWSQSSRPHDQHVFFSMFLSLLWICFSNLQISFSCVFVFSWPPLSRVLFSPWSWSSVECLLLSSLDSLNLFLKLGLSFEVLCPGVHLGHSH